MRRKTFNPKVGDYVYCKEFGRKYTKTTFKIAYVEARYRDSQRVLVEVDDNKNRRDKCIIRGWLAEEHLSRTEIERFGVNPQKKYWWVSEYYKASAGKIKNE